MSDWVEVCTKFYITISGYAITWGLFRMAFHSIVKAVTSGELDI